jgi:hypothetical protein
MKGVSSGCRMKVDEMADREGGREGGREDE